MRKLLVTLDDEIGPLLAKFPNQSEIIREALRLYIGDITTDTRQGIVMSYKLLTKALKEIDSKVDYIAGKIDK